jgi:hypothetical protein
MAGDRSAEGLAVARLLRLGKRLARSIRPLLGLSAIVVALALVIPISDSLWAESLIGAGAVHTGSWTPEDHGCTHTPGYWKTHPEEWPEDGIEIGGVVYLDVEAIAVLETPPGGDATYILAHQLIAATLNALAGADASAVQGAIQEGNLWLEEHPLGTDPQNPAREQGLRLSVALVDFNEGRVGPGPCDGEVSREAPTVTATATDTSTAVPTPTDTATSTLTPSATAEPRGAPSETPAPSPTPSDTTAPSPTDASTATLEPTATSKETPGAGPTEFPEATPTDTIAPPPTDVPSTEPPP